ncbi:MAG TPA: YCF48-related protein [Candidatus Margulisiibacteriota bacterium]|nr:YCF48-related protein [Candidatus Margulisiibacteriota bacterium]
MRILGGVHALLGLAAIAVVAGCHKEAEDVPLLTRTIGISDRFYDVHAMDAEKAIVVGYGGKILLTTDAGFTWSQPPSGTNRALYRVRFVDPENGWVSGQEGLMLHTTDGGKTWVRQKTGTSVYLFSLSFIDRNNGWAIGDKSILVQTTDGGTTWALHKITTAAQKEVSAEEAVASADPVLYDVQFVDANNGWVVGEFGKIYHTTDGGQTWTEQQLSLIGAEVVDALDLPTFFGVRFSDAHTGLAAGLDGKIARTTDAGASWKFEKMKLEYPIVDPLYNPLPFPDGTGWAIGAAGEVVRLDTPGGEWQRAKLGMEVVTWLRGMSWLDRDNGWIVGGLGLILHTKDGGKTWIPSLG